MRAFERLAVLKRLFVEKAEGWTTQELAARLDENQRNIQRDLEALQTEPHYFPLVKDRRRWRLMDGHAYQLPRLTLTLHQAVALYLAARLLAHYSDEHNPHVVSALKVLSDVFLEGTGRCIQQVTERLTCCKASTRPLYSLLRFYAFVLSILQQLPPTLRSHSATGGAPMAFWQKKQANFEETDQLIREQPGVRPTDLARQLDVARSTIQRRLPSMEEAGYRYWEDDNGGLWPFGKE